jgi:hypothetical protein
VARISLARGAQLHGDAAALIDEIAEGKHAPLGLRGGLGLPQPIPSHEFALPLQQVVATEPG